MRIIVGLLTIVAALFIAPGVAQATDDVCYQQDAECYTETPLDPEHPELEPQGPDEHEGGQVDCPGGQVGTVVEGVVVCPPPVVVVEDPEPELPPVDETPVDEPVVETPVDEPVVVPAPPVTHEMPSTVVVETPAPVAAAPSTPAAPARPVVRATADTEPVAELAYTGADHTIGMTVAGGALILLGAAFLMFSGKIRRRQR
jgi:LPXTG-motif cell wall-anchored protein